MPSETAIVAGATGLIGRHLLERLSAGGRFAKIVALVRKPQADVPPGVSSLVVDFDHVASLNAPFRDATVFCALGTTMKQAGSQESFRRVDYEYVTGLAKRAAEGGCRRLCLVSALGADASSSVFYNRVKGEAEDAIRKLPIPAVEIIRPSLLLGDRQEFRLAERLTATASRAFSFAFAGPLKRYRPIEADTVAAAMVAVSGEAPKGVRVFESEEIAAIGGG